MLRAFIKENRLFFIAVSLFWMKVYVAQRFFFQVSAENALQEMLLFINPISSSLLLFSLVFLFPKQRRHSFLLTISLISSIVVYANVVYNRFFSDFITLPTLFQTSNMGDLGSSIYTLIQPVDIFLFSDVFLLMYILKKMKDEAVSASKTQVIKLYAVALSFLAFNLILSEFEHPQLLTKSFDRSMVVQNIGILNYHVYDLIVQTKVSAKQTFAKDDGISEIESYIKRYHVKPNPEFTGIASGKNVFIISLESMQSFVINKKVDGEEITPFLNKLIKDSYYFANVYHQTGQGKTSDAEFIIDNSLYPLPRGAVFFTNADNEYHALPKIIGEKGYYSAVFHSNDKTFWNREKMYDSLGYDRFYSSEDFEINEHNVIGWGLNDKEMFLQSIKYLKTLPQPFYAKFLTLTNHFPYLLEEEQITKRYSSSATLERYLKTVRYLDDALRVFFDEVKAAGLYEKSIFILYGDHYGISEYHYDALGEFLGKEITLFDSVQLQRVPLIIHIPGKTGKTISTIGGQIDMKPTILNLLGIENKSDIMFGSDLFAKDRKGLVILRDGSFISDKYVYTKQKCYHRISGEETDLAHCEPFFERVQFELDASDQIIYGDLLKVYKN